MLKGASEVLLPRIVSNSYVTRNCWLSELAMRCVPPGVNGSQRKSRNSVSFERSRMDASSSCPEPKPKLKF